MYATESSEEIELALITQWPLMTREIYTNNLIRIKQRIDKQLLKLQYEPLSDSIPLQKIKRINYQPDDCDQFVFRKLAEEEKESDLYFLSRMPGDDNSAIVDIGKQSSIFNLN